MTPLVKHKTVHHLGHVSVAGPRHVSQAASAKKSEDFDYDGPHMKTSVPGPLSLVLFDYMSPEAIPNTRDRQCLCDTAVTVNGYCPQLQLISY